MKKRYKFSKYVKFSALGIALLIFGAAIIIYPERYVGCCFQGFAMWAECVLPSLFPFMVITLILVKTGMAEKAALPLKKFSKKLNFPPAAAAIFVLSLFSGYPAGSRVVGEFYESGVIDKTESKRISYIASTSGPLFIVGSVGFNMFGDKLAGVKILAAHIIAVTLVSVIVSLFSGKPKQYAKTRKKPDENVLYNAFYGAVISVAVAGGFIAFFFVAATFSADFNLLYPLEKFFNLFLDGQTSSAVCLGLIEATTGCRALAQNAGGGPLQIAAAGFLITFGGVSIILQQLSYLLKTGVSALKFIGVKALQAALCFVILLLIA